MTAPRIRNLNTGQLMGLHQLNQHLIEQGLEKGYDSQYCSGIEEIIGPGIDLPDTDNMDFSTEIGYEDEW